jgi:predicted Zn-dependent protease
VSTPLDVAGQVLDQVRAAGGGQVEAEVAVTRQSTALTRFANSFIHQNVADDTTTVRLRLHADGRTTASSTTVTSADGLRDLVDRTVAAARLAPADPTWPGLAPAVSPVGAPEMDPATADASPDERAARVRAFVDAAGLESAGYCRTSYQSVAFANSAGQTATTHTTEAAMDGIARAGGCDGVARTSSARLADVDGATLGALAGAKARAAVDAVELPPGRYEVVLEPNAVADLLQNFTFHGFNGKAYADRQSFAELGAAQFDPLVTLVDNPLAPGRPGATVDSEGTPKQRLVLIDAGVTSGVTLDRRTATLMGGGARSTGHALTGPFARFGAVALHPELAAGAGPSGGAGAGGDSDGGAHVDPVVAPLLPGVERGLLVTDLWYTRVLDPKTLVVTGLTRNGVWLIEDGKVTNPVQNFRFTQSYPQALGPGQVRGVGPISALVPGAYGSGTRTVPGLHLASWNFTGGASG